MTCGPIQDLCRAGEAEREYVYTNEAGVQYLEFGQIANCLNHPYRVVGKRKLPSSVFRLQIARLEKLLLRSRRGKADGKTIAPLELS